MNAARAFSTKLVIRSRDAVALAAARVAVEAMLADLVAKSGDGTQTDY